MAAAAPSPSFRTATASVNGVFGAGLLSLAENSVTTRSGPLTGVGGCSGVGLVGLVGKELSFPHAAIPSVRLPTKPRIAIRGRLMKLVWEFPGEGDGFGQPRVCASTLEPLHRRVRIKV